MSDRIVRQHNELKQFKASHGSCFWQAVSVRGARARAGAAAACGESGRRRPLRPIAIEAARVGTE